MIELTDYKYKSKRTINHEKIYAIDDYAVESFGATVRFDNGEEWNVLETRQEVARKVLEYKLAMVRYQVGLSLEKPHLWDAEQDKLLSLAGLETWAEKAARELKEHLAGLEDTNDA